jgi:deazaflavin-dependent oxidoreductase (nitroreductase family)
MMMEQNERNERNRLIIEEFRTHAGQVGGQFVGAPLLLLTTRGARSGESRTTPLRYLPDQDRLILFAANAGGATNPAWYYNLLAHPTVTVETGTETVEAVATVLTGEERERLLALQAKVYPHFASYQAKTDRQIPVVALQWRKG